MFNYIASNTDALNATATNKAVSPLVAYSAYGRTAPVTVASTSTLLTTNNIIIATTAGVTLTLPLTSLYATAQLNAAQLVIYNSSAGSITIQGNIGQTINGNATYTLNAGSSVTLIPTTTNAWIMG
jgi:phage gp45-like